MSTTEIRIRGYHLDFYGHVNNARYLEFFEEARWDMLEHHVDLGAWDAEGMGFYVVNINISYRQPVVLGDILIIHSGITHFGTKSAVITQRAFRKGADAPAAEADVTFVIVGPEGKALPMAGWIREKMDVLAV
ncbi:MAG: thioesterase [Deltaproteobacteria bacterium]|nr:MAG: thioesterase [Deltaproteobacteria bacterium]